MPYAIITDTTCDLPEELVNLYNIYSVPVQLIIKGHTFRDGDLSKREIYETLKEETIKTSACLPSDAMEVFDQVKADGYQEAIYISLGSEYSSMYNTVSLLAKDYDGLDIEMFDSHGLSLLFGYLVLEAAKQKDQVNLEEMVTRLAEIRQKMICRCIVNDLKYPVASGRLNKTVGRIGSLMKIKPTMAIEPDGNIHIIATSRGFKKAYKRLIEDFSKSFSGKRIQLVTLRGSDKSIEDRFVSDVEGLAEIIEVFHGEAGVALSAHAGPDVFGYFAYEI